VCFNVDSALDPASRDALSRSGTVHVVSASGLHVGLLAAALLAILGRLPIPRWSQLSVLAFVLVLFAVASGLNPPVIRTCVMALILSTAYLLKREPDMLSALGIAAVVQMLWDPRAIFDPGFQLSFTLIGAFALFASRAGTVRESFRAQLVNKGREGLRQGVVATAGAAPLVAYTFGLVSFTSVVSNLLLALALPVMVVGAMLAHLVSFVVPALGVGLMVGLVGPLAGWLYFVAEHMGGEWAALSVPAFSGYWVLLAYAVMIAAWRPRLRPA
jgi:competence protein ComEC